MKLLIANIYCLVIWVLLQQPAIAAVLLLEQKGDQGEKLYSTVTLSGRTLFTAGHSIKNCLHRCKALRYFYFDEEKSSLIPLKVETRQQQFSVVESLDLATQQLKKMLNLPRSMDQYRGHAGCISFSALHPNININTRMGYNRLMEKLPLKPGGIDYLSRLIVGDIGGIKPGPLDYNQLEIRNSQNREIVYKFIPQLDLWFVRTIFPANARFQQDGQILKAPCAGWHGSSGGAFFHDFGTQHPVGIISGPTTRYTTRLRDHMDYGDLNIVILPESTEFN